MITNIIIFGLDVPSWIFWVIGVVIIIMAGLVFSDHSSTDQMKTEKAISKEKEEKEKEKEKKEQENGYYSLGNSNSDATFFSILDYKISVFWQVHEKATNDTLTISSSWPIGMNEDDLKNFQKLLPEVISIKAINEHELSLKKSPAAKFSSIKEKTLKHLFCHLNNKYAWINQKMIISFHCTLLDRLNCHFREKTSDHITLGVMLGNIPGIINRQTTIAQMEEKNTHQFDLIKNDNVEWKDVLPKIQEVFQTYFTGGVEFIGPNEI